MRLSGFPSGYVLAYRLHALSSSWSVVREDDGLYYLIWPVAGGECYVENVVGAAIHNCEERCYSPGMMLRTIRRLLVDGILATELTDDAGVPQRLKPRYGVDHADDL